MIPRIIGPKKCLSWPHVPFSHRIWGWMLPSTPWKDRADPSLTPGSIFQVIRKLIFNPSPLVAPTPSLTTTLFKSDKPSVVKSFLFAIPGSGETLCSLFPWAFDVLNRTGIFLPKTSHSGRFWLVFGHWTNPGISPRVKST